MSSSPQRRTTSRQVRTPTQDILSCHKKHFFYYFPPCVIVYIILNVVWPPGVAPFSGATTGTGGRIRDVQSAGKGGHVIAGTAGYCFGNLHIPGLQKNETLHPSSYSMKYHKLKYYSHYCPLQVMSSPGSLQERVGTTHPALLLHCRWQSRPAMVPQTTATSLENLSCQVEKSTVAKC